MRSGNDPVAGPYWGLLVSDGHLTVQALSSKRLNLYFLSNGRSDGFSACTNSRRNSILPANLYPHFSNSQISVDTNFGKSVRCCNICSL